MKSERVPPIGLRPEIVDRVPIGAGVRKNELESFGKLVDIARVEAPHVHGSLDTGPTNPVDAIRRWP